MMKSTTITINKTILSSLFFVFSIFYLNGQTVLKNGMVIWTQSIGNKEFSSILDKESGCILRTSSHKKDLFKLNEEVSIKFETDSKTGVILQYVNNSFHKIIVDYSNCKNLSNNKKSVNYIAPESPFPNCQTDNNPIGGGYGYNSLTSPVYTNVIDINTNISTIQFVNTIQNATNGTLINIDGNLTFDLSNLFSKTGFESITIPEGVTIRSSRGDDNGALLYTYDKSIMGGGTSQIKGAPLFIIGGNNVKISGIRFKGPTQSINSKEYVLIKRCFYLPGEFHSLEIDNCVFYGWPTSAIKIGDKGNSTIGTFKNNNIHHCYFFNNRQESFGYGVEIYNGFVKIYSNTFEANRHDIAGGGEISSGYEASCNTIRSGGTYHNFDMHAFGTNDASAVAGRFIYIHHNDFLDLGEFRVKDDNKCNIKIRGRPITQCRIENNRFKHDGPRSAIQQHNNKTEGYGNMLVWNNIYNSKDYLGWYVKNHFLKTNTTNFVNLKSTNDIFLFSTDMYYGTAFGDFDGDGKTDVFKLENGKLYTIPLDANIYGISSQWQHILTTDYPISSLRFDFFDGDNKTDVIVHDENKILVSWGCSTQWNHLNTTYYNLSTLKLGDFDGNGITDLFLSDGTRWYASYNSNSPWQTINHSSYEGLDILLGKFNNNNISDVFLADGSNFMVSHEGTSTWINYIQSSYHTLDLFSADFNGDNISDIIEPSIRMISIGANLEWNYCNTINFPISTFTFGDF